MFSNSQRTSLFWNTEHTERGWTVQPTGALLCFRVCNMLARNEQYREWKRVFLSLSIVGSYLKSSRNKSNAHWTKVLVPVKYAICVSLWLCMFLSTQKARRCSIKTTPQGIDWSLEESREELVDVLKRYEKEPGTTCSFQQQLGVALFDKFHSLGMLMNWLW